MKQLRPHIVINGYKWYVVAAQQLPHNSKSIQELETEKLSQEISRRVSQLSIINPAKTGQTGQIQSDTVRCLFPPRSRVGRWSSDRAFAWSQPPSTAPWNERRDDWDGAPGTAEIGSLRWWMAHRFSMAIPAMNGGMVVIVVIIFLKGWVAIIEDSSHKATTQRLFMERKWPKLLQNWLIWFSWQCLFRSIQG